VFWRRLLERGTHPSAQAKKLSARLQKGGTVAGYSNESNPFGDANLTQRCAGLGLWLCLF